MDSKEGKEKTLGWKQKLKFACGGKEQYEKVFLIHICY
jgi:hypothetical protein